MIAQRPAQPRRVVTERRDPLPQSAVTLEIPDQVAMALRDDLLVERVDERAAVLLSSFSKVAVLSEIRAGQAQRKRSDLVAARLR